MNLGSEHTPRAVAFDIAVGDGFTATWGSGFPDEPRVSLVEMSGTSWRDVVCWPGASCLKISNHGIAVGRQDVDYVWEAEEGTPRLNHIDRTGRIIVGDEGTVIERIDGKTPQWQRMELPTQNDLHGVDTTSTHGYVVGDGGTVFVRPMDQGNEDWQRWDLDLEVDLVDVVAIEGGEQVYVSGREGALFELEPMKSDAVAIDTPAEGRLHIEGSEGLLVLGGEDGRVYGRFDQGWAGFTVGAGSIRDLVTV